MNFDFIKGKIKNIDIKISNSFNKLPSDKNEKSKGYFFRFRKFSKFNYIKKKFILDPGSNFYQKKKTNRFAGGKIRKFANIDNNILNKIIKLIEKNFIIFLDKNKDYNFGVHCLRIKCGNNFVGYPVPEGWHKDGFDFVIVLNITSKNIQGGTTRLKTNMNLDKKDDFAEFLKKGEFVFFNDRKYNHYTDPITIDNEKKKSFRDTIVITVKKLN